MVEASGRHVHLTKEHVEALFGEGYELTPVKDLSQPGQFAAKERVRVIGPKGEFSSVAILGPCRNFFSSRVINLLTAVKLESKE